MWLYSLVIIFRLDLPILCSLACRRRRPCETRNSQAAYTDLYSLGHIAPTPTEANSAPTAQVLDRGTFARLLLERRCQGDGQPWQQGGIEERIKRCRPEGMEAALLRCESGPSDDVPPVEV